jgi:hypothetical protein
MTSVTKAARSIDRSDLPTPSHDTARDDSVLVYRAYPAASDRVAVHRFGIHSFDGLPVVLFAVSPGSAEVTPSYSARLARNFGANLDYRVISARANAP